MEAHAGGDAQFGEDLAKVPFDGAGADEQFRGDLRVGASVSGQPGDVLLLRGEFGVGVDLPLADRLAGGEQFPAGPLGEGLSANRGEQVVGGAQLVACVTPPELAAKPLAVEQVGTGELGPQPGAAEPLDRLGVVVLGIVAFAEQRSRACLQALRPVGTLDGRHGRQPLQRFPGNLCLPGSHGRLDQFGQNQLCAQGQVGFPGCRFRRSQCLCISPETIVEDRGGPAGELDSESLPASDRVLDGRREQGHRFRRPAPVPGEQQITGRSQADSGHLVDDVLFRGQRRRRLEVTAQRGYLSASVQSDGQRAQGARCAGELDVPGAHLDPAVEVPHGHGRHLGDDPPLQPLFPGHLITDECVHRPPQRRLCCRTSLDDHRRQTIQEQVTRPRSPRWRRGRACRPGDLQKKTAGSCERTSDAGCHPGVEVGLPGEPDIE